MLCNRALRLLALAGLASCSIGYGFAGSASAEGFAEAAVGLVTPLGDDDWDKAADGSLELGLRLGAELTRTGKTALSLEVSGAWSPLSEAADSAIVDVSANRIRGLVGLRVVHTLGERAELVARFGLGIDYVRFTTMSTLGGVTFEATESDVGFALAPSIAVLAGGAGEPRGARFGVQIGLPTAFHSSTDGAFAIDYTSLDLQLLVVASAAL